MPGPGAEAAGREGKGKAGESCLAHCSVCPTEDEKAEAREFEEDQVAGRLKEDVVCVGAP